MSKFGPIFIVSSERSGSNLLRTLLDNHSDLHGPRAPHLLHSFAGMGHYYHPFDQGKTTLLLGDMLALANHEYFGWDLKVNAESLYAKYQPHSLVTCFAALYQEKTRAEGAQRFICKENDLFRYVFPLWRDFPNAKFLYLYRDPRAYAASWLKVPFRHNTPYNAAISWRNEQQMCLELFRSFSVPSAFVSYEELTEDTAGTMTRVLEFVGSPIEECCFDVESDKNASDGNNPFLTNLSQGVDPTKRQKYLEEFSPQTLKVIEATARQPMKSLGYTFHTDAQWQPDTWFRLRNRVEDYRARKRLEKAHQQTVAQIKNVGSLLRNIRERNQSSSAS